MVRKSITLPQDLAEYSDENIYNLSGFVQQKLRQHKEKQRMLKEADLQRIVKELQGRMDQE